MHPPAPRAIICRAAACEQKKTPLSWTPIMLRQSSGVTSSDAHGLLTPALLTNTSSRPYRETAPAISASQAAGSVTSHGCAAAVNPAARNSAAASSAASPRKSPIITA